MRTATISCATLALAALAAMTALAATPPPAGAAEPGPLATLGYLLGAWEATGSGKPDEPTGGTTFSPALQGRIIQRTNHADYPAAEGRPASTHDDLMVIYAETGSRVRADYYDNEGHVIRYTVQSPAPGVTVFLGDVTASAPRFRLTYRLAADGTVNGTFEIAPAGKPEAFNPYLSWDLRKIGAGPVVKRPQ